jgi:hypothetical protein
MQVGISLLVILKSSLSKGFARLTYLQSGSLPLVRMPDPRH